MPLKPLIVSSRLTKTPGVPVNTSATWKGCDRKALDLAGAGDGQLVFFRQFVHAEDRDDVLQRFVGLQDALDVARDLVMLVADDPRVEHARGRVERVDRRINAEFGDLARQHRGRVEMGEGRGRRRVGQIVGGHIDRLHRGDRPLFRGRDPLLERPQIGCQGRLIADRRRDTAEQCRHLGAGLGKAEDVVDKEQHVLAFLVAEIFGDGEPGEADARARTRRLVHLAIDERRLGARPVDVDDPRFHHLMIEIVALAGALADAGEHRIAAMRLGDVVDQLHDDHGLADPGAAEQPDFAASRIGRQQIDDLDPGDQDLALRSIGR